MEIISTVPGSFSVYKECILYITPFSQFRLILSDLMESDLHQIIVSPQQLTEDHVKVFVYQVLRGMLLLHNYTGVVKL